MTFELTLLVWSVVLLFAHIGAQAVLMTRDMGPAYNAGPRDETPNLSPLAGRAERALRNYLETWPGFIALALIVAITGLSDGFTQWGAGIYLFFRIIYLPLYLLAIPYLRSLAFSGACVGLMVMVVGLLL